MEIAVEVGHAEESLVEVALGLELEGQVVVLETPAGAAERLGLIEPDAVGEDRAAEQAVLSPRDQVGGLPGQRRHAPDVGAGQVAVGRLPGRVGAQAAQGVPAVFHVAEHGEAGEGHDLDIAVHEQQVVSAPVQHDVDDLVGAMEFPWFTRLNRNRCGTSTSASKARMASAVPSVEPLSQTQSGDRSVLDMTGLNTAAGVCSPVRALARPLGGDGVPADGAGDGAQLSLVAVDDQHPRTFRHEERGRDVGRAAAAGMTRGQIRPAITGACTAPR